MSNQSTINLEGFHQFAVDLAYKAGKHTLEYFNKSVQIDRKSDKSPVTVADRETEALMREAISKSFPDHNIIGEEFDNKETDSDFTWILDPIDGTRSFIHGIPLYTTLIGLTFKGQPISGVIYAPATNEMVEAGSGLGCRFNGSSTTVSGCSSLAESTYCTTDAGLYRDVGLMEVHEKIEERVLLHRTWGDAYGHLKVASGQIDIMVDPILNIWDAAALLPIISEAGGAFVDFSGTSRIDGGNGISGNPVLVQEILTIINSTDYKP